MKFTKYIKPKKFFNTSNPFSIRSGKIKDGKIDSVYRSTWSEDVYISDSKEKDRIGRNFNLNSLPLLLSILVFFILILIAKISWLQIAQGAHYREMADGNRIRIQRIEPKRGVIYDRNYQALVRNKANFMLYIVPADLSDKREEVDRIITIISDLLNIVTKEEIQEKLANVDMSSLSAYNPIFIVDHIPYEEALKLYLYSDNWSGVIISNKTNRSYPVFVNNTTDDVYLSLSHILGYTGKINEKELEKFGKEYQPIDYIGKMGIEYFWENELKGKSGKKKIEVDALGKEKKILGQIGEVDGNNLVLSLDINQQLKLEEILRDYLKRLKLNKAAALVINPNNGEVVAMVSLPAYNNNSFARGISQEEYTALINDPDHPLFNRTISGDYPSGSTFKLIMSAAALEEGIITEKTSFMSYGGVRIGEWFFPDWRAGGHGRTNVKKAIADSVNTFFYYIGGGNDDFTGLGVDRIVEYGRFFGLGSQLGIDLAGEVDGFLPTRQWKEEVKGERWYIGDTYHLAIGQGDLLVTPLQVAMYTSVFANGGKLYRPHFVKQILSSDDHLISETKEDPIREDFIDDYNIEIVRQGMRQGVTAGSSRRLSLLSVSSAGKTGTAQWSSKGETHAWFTGFAPFDDPELVITILVEEGGEGSEVAVPIAYDFLKWYFGEYKEQLKDNL